MLRYAQSIRGGAVTTRQQQRDQDARIANIRNEVHGRLNVRRYRPILESDFNRVQDALAGDYRLSQFQGIRASRRARQAPNRILFDTTLITQQGYANIQIFQRPDDNQDYRDLSIYLHSLQPIVRHWVLHYFRSPWRGVGFKLAVRILYADAQNFNNESVQTVMSKPYYVLTYRDLDRTIRDMLAEIETRSLLFFEQGSDKVIVRLDPPHLLKIWQQSQAPGIVGSGDLNRYMGGAWIELPNWIKNKKACVNFKNTDDKCFQYCLEWQFLEMSLNPIVDKPNPQRCDWFDPENCGYDWKDVNMPATFDDIDIFEENNADKEICVRVMVPREDVNFSLSIVRDCSELIKKYVNPVVVMLLLIADESSDNYHYVYIKGTDGLLKIVRRHLPKTKGKMYMCQRCMRSFHTEMLMSHHRSFQCADDDYRLPELPWAERSWKYFSDMRQFNQSPIIIIYDFESVNARIDHEEGETKTQASKMSTQIPVSFGITALCPEKPEFTILPHLVTVDEPLLEGETFAVNRTTIMEQFHKWLVDRADYFDDVINQYFRFHFSGADSLSAEQKKEFEDSEECSICHLDLDNGWMPHWEWTVINRDSKNSGWNFAYQATLETFDPSHRNYEKAREMRKENLAFNQYKIHAHDPKLETNNYVGAAHRICANAIGKYKPIPCLAHNSTRYDNHLVIQGFSPARYKIASLCRVNNMFKAIASESDRFKTFTLSQKYEFLDSYAYLSASLDTLVSNALKDGKDKLPFTRQVLAQYLKENFSDPEGDDLIITEEIEDLLLKKGVYPYEWLDCPTKLKTTGPFSWEAFRSSLRMNTESSDKELETKTWPLFCDTWAKLQDLMPHRQMIMLDYHDLYLLRDVALLADIVMNYRKLCLKDSGLEALATPTLPGYTQNHLLLYNTLKQPTPRATPFYIQLLHKGQEDMYLFYEDGIRGGLSIAPGRYSKANNRHVADYDPSKATKEIFYFDMTNLYGRAMCMPLPEGDYQWEVCEEGYTMMDHWSQIGRFTELDAKEGYTYEIDGYFPILCHDKLKNLPPLPHKYRINSMMTSPFYQMQMDRYGLKHDAKTRKLLASLLKRECYIADYRNLQQAEKLGFVITKVHRVCCYKQSKWCEDYVMHNTNHRKLEKTVEGKNYFKLKVNAGYGKMVQDNRKHRNIKMKLNTDMDPREHETKGQYEDWEVMNDEFSLMKEKPDTVNMNSPVPVGFTILEWSKWLMYDFYYEKLYPVFGEQMRLLFMDTDSLCIEFTSLAGEDVMSTMKLRELLQYFDMSDWPADESYHGQNYFDPANKKVPGTMKDEMAEERAYIAEVVAMKSKMYSVLKHDDTQKATAKGVPEDIKRKVLNHNQYLDAVFQRGDYADTLPKVTTHNIRSELNTMTIRKMQKMTLNPCDSKAFMFDQVTTLPYGHYKVLEAQTIIDPFSN